MHFARKSALAGAALGLLAIAGCQTGPGPGLTTPVVRAPQGVEGEWLSTDGVAMSRFNAGTFETLAVDTGNKLATGTYQNTSPTMVTISVTSIIRQTTSSVNCSLVTATQMNCTSSAGQQFVLVRKQPGVA